MPTTSYSPSETAQPTVSTSWRVCRACLFLAAALAVIRTAIFVRAHWISDAGIDHAGGVMIAMAVDLTHGIFYRPLFGLEGYGGTRYFPLYSVLHAILLKLGIPVLLGVYLLSLAAMLFLVAGVFRLLVRMGTERWLAAACAGTLLASGCAQYAIVSARADTLASALNIWGLWMVLGPKSWRRTLFAALLFALAWSAKLTTCFGLAAAVLWLLNIGLRRRALQLALTTIAGYLLVATAIFVGSHGRVLEIFKACALAGTPWKRLLAGPFVMGWIAFHHDLSILLLACFALMMLLLELPECLKYLSSWFFIVAALTTMAIYGSEGTSTNHLLDIQIAAVIILGCVVARTSQLHKQAGIYALALATFIPAGRGAPFTRNGNHFHGVIRSIGKTAKPVLAENPIIPVLTGHPAYVLDPWMLCVLRKQIPNFGEPLLLQLRSRAFGAVVLFVNPETDDGRDWYSTEKFGPGFTAALTENYRLLSVIDGQFVYVPISDPAPPLDGR